MLWGPPAWHSKSDDHDTLQRLVNASGVRLIGRLQIFKQSSSLPNGQFNGSSKKREDQWQRFPLSEGP